MTHFPNCMIQNDLSVVIRMCISSFNNNKVNEKFREKNKFCKNGRVQTGAFVLGNWLSERLWLWIMIYWAQTGSLMLHWSVSYMLNNWILIIVLKRTLQPYNKCRDNEDWLLKHLNSLPNISQKQWRNKICTQRQNEKFVEWWDWRH